MHDFIYVGVRPDAKSRPIAFHEWCTRCGTLRSTRLADGDVIHLVAGVSSASKEEEQCVPVRDNPRARA